MRPFGCVPLGTIDFLYFNFTENEQNNLFVSTLVQTWENHACLQGRHKPTFGGAEGPEFDPSVPKMIAFLEIYFSFRDNSNPSLLFHEPRGFIKLDLLRCWYVPAYHKV